MVDMEEWLSTDTSGMAITLSLGMVGYMAGSALSSVVYDRFLLELQLVFDAVLMGSCVALAPWWRSLVVYCVFIMIRGVAMGLIDSSGQGYLLSLMVGHRYRNPAMQFLHGIWSVGASTGPLIVKPFLRPDKRDLIQANTTGTINYSTMANYTYIMSGNATLNTTVSGEANSPSELRVMYAFLTIGLIIIALGIPMFLAYISGPVRIFAYKKNIEKEQGRKSTTNEPRKFRIVLLTMLFFWYYFYLWAEDLPGSFLAPFVIKYLGWPRHTGPLITTTLWGSHGIGRLLAVPVSIFATPRQMIIASVTLTALGYILLVILMNIHPAFVWISVALAGLGMASSFGTMVLWSSKHVRIGGTAAAIFILGASTGGMSAPVLAGFLFENVSPMWTVYMMLAGALMVILLYVILELYVRFVNAPDNSQAVPDTTGYKQTANSRELKAL